MAIDRSAIVQEIGSLIKLFREKPVMLDFDLAQLYGVGTKYINRAVKPNTERFPEDFYFELSNQVCGVGAEDHRHLPLLSSKEAAMVNVQIMPEVLSSHSELSFKLQQLEYRLGKLPIPTRVKNRMGN